MTAYRAVSTALARYSDRALCDLVDAAEPVGAGIGGTSARLSVAGHPVSVKRVPLTDLELRPEHVRSTANLFEVPDFPDRCYTVTYLVNWLLTALHGLRREDRDRRYELVRAYAEGERPSGLPEGVAATVARHAPVAAVVSDFNRTFQRRSRRTPYPLERLRRLG
ncbi:hypothetical protein [Streptacidiphilus monticola]|uniref:Uncharacterized protein n=1 Tax=Streptacidiphilus monticola TaxID=2161674 RepID=A0ABW1FTN4_9ACTN